MIKALSDIITPFLALGVTLLIAYLIYLYSSQANIDEKIQLEGSEIAVELKKAPTYKMSLSLFDFFLLKEYQDKYPNKPYLEILQMIAGDLNGAALFKQKDSIDRLASFEKGNLKGPIIGRVFFWLIETSMDYLAPKEIYWPGRGYVKSLHNRPATPQSELFPFGPLRVEQWSNDFQTIKNYIEFLYVDRDIFLNDLKQFIKQLDEKDNWTRSFKKHLTEIDYEAWLREMDSAFSSIETHNDRIRSLLALKKNYSIEERLPNVKWIAFLSALCFIFGIGIPLIFLCFQLENSIPSIVNLVITVASFVFFFGGTILLIKDVLPSHKKESHVRYLFPLKNQLLKYKTQQSQMVSFDYTIVNSALSDKSIKLSRKLVNILEQYQKTVIDSNSASNQMAGILSEAIQQSDVLKSYRAEPLSGGQTISIISLLLPDMRKSFLEKLPNSSDNLILQANYEKVTTDIFKIKPPKDKEQLDKLTSEIDKIYDKYSASTEAQTCISKRKELESIRNKLLQQIDYELK